MAIILSQKFKQKQKLALTPSLKKSIDLLQLSRFELINKIQQEIEDNPFLEKIEDFENDSLLDKDFSFEIWHPNKNSNIIVPKISKFWRECKQNNTYHPSHKRILS